MLGFETKGLSSIYVESLNEEGIFVCVADPVSYSIVTLPILFQIAIGIFFSILY